VRESEGEKEKEGRRGKGGGSERGKVTEGKTSSVRARERTSERGWGETVGGRQS